MKHYDLAIIGGGIHGCGIARDAAGRGIKVGLFEKKDLASGTSSASTKLIHGGLRYLEHFEFRLVWESLKEREILLKTAPHLVSPLRFVFPQNEAIRSSWLIRLGLFLYDTMGRRKILPKTSTVDLKKNLVGQNLHRQYKKAFEYSDCWVDDARLVVLNAVDAASNGADIHTYTTCKKIDYENDLWKLNLDSLGKTFSVSAKAVINATGPWLENLPQVENLSQNKQNSKKISLRLVKGSHIIINKKPLHDKAYIFQNKDGRIVFTIPYLKKYLLVGTTDVEFSSNPDKIKISPEEKDYLMDTYNQYFLEKISQKDIFWSYSGVRSLLDDGNEEAKKIGRDYLLKLELKNKKSPLLHIYGGKLTTYRKLAEKSLHLLKPYLKMKKNWTASSPLPGGDFGLAEIENIICKIQSSCAGLERENAERLFRNYGTMAFQLLKKKDNIKKLGEYFGAGLYASEVDYLVQNEWAKTMEDILWRRTKLGLELKKEGLKKLEKYLIKIGIY